MASVIKFLGDSDLMLRVQEDVGAIRDAHAAGLIRAPDAASKSRILFAYYQGLATQARILNSLDVLREAIHGTYELLGVETPEPVPA